jgi:NADH dehydrogenase FAD-containing subunit
VANVDAKDMTPLQLHRTILNGLRAALVEIFEEEYGEDNVRISNESGVSEIRIAGVTVKKVEEMLREVLQD